MISNIPIISGNNEIGTATIDGDTIIIKCKGDQVGALEEIARLNLLAAIRIETVVYPGYPKE